MPLVVTYQSDYLFGIVFSGMGLSCSRLFRRRGARLAANAERGNVVDLHEDLLPFPVQCVDDDDYYDDDDNFGGDFVDLHQDVFPVLCS